MAVEDLAREMGAAKALGAQAVVAREAAVMAPEAMAREVGVAKARVAAAARAAARAPHMQGEQREAGYYTA